VRTMNAFFWSALCLAGAVALVVGLIAAFS
jgi:hypothetical protein